MRSYSVSSASASARHCSSSGTGFLTESTKRLPGGSPDAGPLALAVEERDQADAQPVRGHRDGAVGGRDLVVRARCRKQEAVGEREGDGLAAVVGRADLTGSPGNP